MPRFAAVLMIFYLAVPAGATPVAVPNFSFESPPVVRDEQNPFGALPFIDEWDETAVGLADEDDQNTGVFINTDPMEPDHITNAHLLRLAFISSLIGNDVRQELVDTFEVGTAYQLTVAVGTSLNLPVGATEELEIALFYFDGGVEQVVASTSAAGGDVGTVVLVDVVLDMPAVAGTDAWANQPIGVLIRPSVTDPDDADGEGFWNVDQVRLEAIVPTPPGDVNCDGMVNLADAQALADVLVEADTDPCRVDAADVNGDEQRDGHDIQALVGILTTP